MDEITGFENQLNQSYVDSCTPVFENCLSFYGRLDSCAADSRTKPSESEISVLPPVELVEQADFSLSSMLASRDDKQTFAAFDAICSETQGPSLTEMQKISYIELSGDQKQMFQAGVEQLTMLAEGIVNPADYMVNLMNTAAVLADANGREPGSWNIFKPTGALLYKDYLGLVFSEQSMGIFADSERAILSSAPSLLGSALEQVYERLVASQGSDSFNSNVVDVDPSSTVTHHFRELLMVGYGSGKYIADKGTAFLDKADKNPGDVRNGYFASMLGAALAQGAIAPSDAAGMTAWAYAKHDCEQPLWGESSEPGAFVRPQDYDIDDWLAAYYNATRTNVE